MSGRLDGQVAVITGGTSGIGRATAELFVKEGARVVIAGRSDEKGKQIEKDLGKNVVYRRTDVTDDAEIEALMGFAAERFSRIDCLFNNAGAPSRGDIESVTRQDFENSGGGRFVSVECFVANFSINAGMSSGRSSNGGILIVTVPRR